MNNIEGKKKDELLEKLSDGLKLTHNPEDDARKQGRVFFNLCKLLKIEL